MEAKDLLSSIKNVISSESDYEYRQSELDELDEAIIEYLLMVVNDCISERTNEEEFLDAIYAPLEDSGIVTEDICRNLVRFLMGSLDTTNTNSYFDSVYTGKKIRDGDSTAIRMMDTIKENDNSILLGLGGSLANNNSNIVTLRNDRRSKVDQNALLKREIALARKKREKESKLKIAEEKKKERTRRERMILMGIDVDKVSSAPDAIGTSATMSSSLSEEDRKAYAASGRRVIESRDLILTNLEMNYGGKILLENSNISIMHARRYGVVGRNGIGKTTFFRYLVERKFEGIPVNLSIMHVVEEVSGDTSVSVLDMVLGADVERTKLMSEAEKLMKNDHHGSNARLIEVYDRLAEIDADKAESKASSILRGLQFTAAMQNRPCSTYSGGWRMRISLAQALFANPDVLLLDEVNHLDVPALVWLEEYLTTTFTKTLLIVSHQKDFLNRVCTDIIHLTNLKFHHYHGNYDTFEQVRAEKLANDMRVKQANDMRRKHLQSYVDRFRYKAGTAKMAQSRIKMLQKMQESPHIPHDHRVVFSFPDPENELPDGGLIQFKDVAFAWPELVNKNMFLFNGLNLSIRKDTRVAIVGANGQGKSTLMKLMEGTLLPIKGEVIRNPRVRIARFSQHHVDSLDMSKSPAEFLMKSVPEYIQELQTARAQLGRFGLSGEVVMRPISTLSGGQKSRVAFAIVAARKPGIILLDEPTNWLDLDSIEALADALNEFQGAIVLITHDSYFINLISDSLWVVGTPAADADKAAELNYTRIVASWDGDFNSYRKSLIRHIKSSNAAEPLYV